MAVPIAIAGSSAQVGRGLVIEFAVHDAVADALAAAGLPLSSVDLVVTVGSDILDGGMVATRSGIAGAYGRELVTVPSSAGHAFAAAMSFLESGQARTILLAGWGEGTKFVEVDGRIIQADPFYARPVGASAQAMAALQAQRLIANGGLTIELLSDYGTEMHARAGVASTVSPKVATWLTPQWSDGACALVLVAGDGPVHVSDVGVSFRPYCPQPADIDPATWIRDAMARMAAPSPDLAVIEAAAPTAMCEVTALAPILTTAGWQRKDHRVNASGGGAAAYFGPATGLRHIAAVANALMGQTGTGLALDLAGPIGQATTVIAFRGNGS